MAIHSNQKKRRYLDRQGRNMNSLWLKVLIGAIITLMVCGFSAIENRKLDKSVFDLHREQKQVDQQRVEAQLTRIEDKVDKIAEK